MVTVPATDLAREQLGRPLPNTALLGAFAALTGVVALDAVQDAIRQRFPARWPRPTPSSPTAAHDRVPSSRWEVRSDA